MAKLNSVHNRTASELSAMPFAAPTGGHLRQYSKADAEEILKVGGFFNGYGGMGIAAEHSPFGDHLIVVDETGVSPDKTLNHRSLLWKPCLELVDEPDAPDANLTPGLPFPFTATQLAMFMLDGPGLFVTSAFGEWIDQPNQDTLDSMGLYANRAREAVVAAFAFYHCAVKVVGLGHLEPEAYSEAAGQRYKAARAAACIKHQTDQSHISRDQYWIRVAMVNKEVEPLLQDLVAAQNKSALARSLWRKAMVKELSRHSALQTKFYYQGKALTDAAASDVAPILPMSEPRNAAIGPIFSMNRAALIDAHNHEWPTIRRDIADANTNGLSAAKSGNRGWNEAVALKWARAKGKLKSSAKPVVALTQAMQSMSSLPGRKHTLEG